MKLHSILHNIVIDDVTTCHNWLGSVNEDGYGRCRLNGRMTYVHRIFYEHVHGVIPSGLYVLHDCPRGDNPRCCNVDHLWLGTRGANNKDRVKKGRSANTVGMSNPSSKLTDDEVIEIRQRFSTGDYTLAQLGRRFEVTRQLIWQVVNCHAWTHI